MVYHTAAILLEELSQTAKQSRGASVSRGGGSIGAGSTGMEEHRGQGLAKTMG
jgi:hypothetical protein